MSDTEQDPVGSDGEQDPENIEDEPQDDPAPEGEDAATQEGEVGEPAKPVSLSAGV